MSFENKSMPVMSRTCKFETDRLLVQEWHSFSSYDPLEQDLAQTVSAMLTPSVTQSLPEHWHGDYTVERAREWIADRDREGAALLVVERSSNLPIGLIILFESNELLIGRTVRLGYLLSESVWGRGLVSELVRAFVEWCRTVDIVLILAGVERDNIPSQRVLEKCGFVNQTSDDDKGELVFELRL